MNPLIRMHNYSPWCNVNNKPFQEIDQDVATIFLVDDYATMSKAQTRELIYAVQGVIPQEIIDHFESIVHFEDLMQWEKGDLVNQIWEHVQAAKLPYKFMDICYFVSSRFLNYTRSPNTVKAWALTARRFSAPVREKYNYEDVPFAHFAYAAKRKFDRISPDGKRTWQKILEYSYEGRNAQSYDVSVAQLEEAFEGKVRAVPGYQRGSENVELPTPVVLDSLSVEIEFANALAAITQLASRLSGNPQIVSLIEQGLNLLRVALDQLAKEEKS